MKFSKYKQKCLDILSTANQLTPHKSLNRCRWLILDTAQSKTGVSFKSDVPALKTQRGWFGSKRKDILFYF